MKKITTVLAVVGVFVIAGALGNDDVMVMHHVAYPLSATFKTVAIGVCMTVPAIVRSIYGKKFT